MSKNNSIDSANTAKSLYDIYMAICNNVLEVEKIYSAMYTF